MISRRRLVATGASSAVLGVLAGAIGANYSRGSASIRFLGSRESMLVLIDSGRERALIVLGDQHDEMLTNIPGLSTLGNQRFDLVIATHRVLSTRMAREHLNIDAVQTLCIQGDHSVSPLRGTIITTTESIGVRMGADTLINVLPLGTGEIPARADHPDFLVEVLRDETRILLGTSSNAFLRAATAPANMVAVPGEPNRAVLDSTGCEVIVCNTPNSELDSASQMQVNSMDPVVARFENGAISVNRHQFSS